MQFIHITEYTPHWGVCIYIGAVHSYNRVYGRFYELDFYKKHIVILDISEKLAMDMLNVEMVVGHGDTAACCTSPEKETGTHTTCMVNSYQRKVAGVFGQHALALIPCGRGTRSILLR